MHEIYSGYSQFFEDACPMISHTGYCIVIKNCHCPALPCENDHPAMTQIKSPFGTETQCPISEGLFHNLVQFILCCAAAFRTMHS